MNISDCVQNDDGSLDFNFHVNEEEAAFLMDFAIKSLIHQGIIKVTAESQEISLETFPDTEGGMQ
jgi:hypothetical protein